MLSGMGVGNTLIFNSKGVSDDTVLKTSPAAGAPIKKGDTVKIYVDEAAPQLGVPDVVGLDCKTAGKQIAATGFTPAYPTGHNGVVNGENPAPTEQNWHWNQTVQLMCGVPTSPSPSPSVSASVGPSVGPSGT